MSLNEIFKKKLEELNLKRRERGKSILYKKDLAVVIFAGEKANDNFKSQMLSLVLTGKRRPFNSDELRVIRKIFGCTIDELFPISEDLDIELPKTMR